MNSTTGLVRRLAAGMGIPARLIPIPSRLLRTAAGFVGKGAAAQQLCGSLQVDITKTRQRLEWTPPLSLDEGLRKAANGFLLTANRASRG